MAQSIAFTRRQLGRAKATAEAALAATEGQKTALKALAPDMVAACVAFETLDRAGRDAELSTSREVAEGNTALTALARMFDQAREVTAAKLGVTYEAASAFATPDDLLAAAEDLEAQLEQAEESWAEPLRGSFSDTLDTATREQTQASAARKAQQKVQLERQQAEAAARPILLSFRRLVRAAFGASSREYRELLDRRSHTIEPDPPAEGNSAGS